MEPIARFAAGATQVLGARKTVESIRWGIYNSEERSGERKETRTGQGRRAGRKKRSSEMGRKVSVRDFSLFSSALIKVAVSARALSSKYTSAPLLCFAPAVQT